MKIKIKDENLYLLLFLIIILSILLLIIYIWIQSQRNFENFIQNNDNITVVISRFAENINWIYDYPFNLCKIICYNKGKPFDDNFKIPNNCKIITLNNVGRESHTYLTYIIDNYNNLSKVTVFLPASCMDEHKRSKTLFVINKAVKTENTVLSGSIFNDNIREVFKDFSLDVWKNTNINNISINPIINLKLSELRPFYKWYDNNFENVDNHVVCWFGIFAVSKKHIIQHPIEKYKNLLHYLDDHHNPEVGHYMERSWGTLFYPYEKECVFSNQY